ncbi:MAG: MaoC/PaaZ C-terminal domain-containing protein [Bacillota bacterium]
MSQTYFEDVQLNEAIPALDKDTIERLQLVMYAGASGDFNPIHTITEAADAQGLGDVIAHGMLSMGFLGQYVTNLAGPGGMVNKLQVRFGQMVRPKDTLTLKGVVTGKDDCKNLVSLDVWAENQRGEAVTKGVAQVTLPSKSGCGCSCDCK